MDEDDDVVGGVTHDRSKIYMIGVAVGIVVALVGIWLSPISAEIGRREIGVGYMIGEFMTIAGSILALLSVVLTVVDS